MGWKVNARCCSILHDNNLNRSIYTLFYIPIIKIRKWSHTQKKRWITCLIFVKW